MAEGNKEKCCKQKVMLRGKMLCMLILHRKDVSCANLKYYSHGLVNGSVTNICRLYAGFFLLLCLLLLLLKIRFGVLIIV